MSSGKTSRRLRGRNRHREALLTTLEAAKFFGVSADTLKDWRSGRGKGRGPAYIKFGPAQNNRVRYRLGDLKAWLEKHLVRPKAK